MFTNKNIHQSVIAASFLFAPIAVGITIRDDVPVSTYDLLADDPAFIAAAWLGDSFSGQFCSGTLIAPDTILTAAHCVDFDNNGALDAAATAHAVGFGENVPATITPNVASIVVHPQWASSGGSEAFDLAIVRLVNPITGITPLEIGTANPNGATGTSVGYGIQGTGLTGEDLNGLDGADDRLGGQNEITTNTTGFTYNGFSVATGTLMADFDDPNGMVGNAVGGEAPLDNEAATASGDSGSGLLVDLDGDGVFEVAGVLSGGVPAPGGEISEYGDLSFWTWLGSDSSISFLQANGFLLGDVVPPPVFVAPTSEIGWGVYNLHQAGLSTTFRDLNSRVLRNRNSARTFSKTEPGRAYYSNTTEFVDPSQPQSSEEGVVNAANSLHFFGSAHTQFESYDSFSGVTGTGSGNDSLLYGGTVGVEFDPHSYVTLGIGVMASSGDLDLNSLDTVEADFIGYAAYATLQLPITHSIELIGDVMIGKMRGSYDTKRDFGDFIGVDQGEANGSTDSETDLLELSLGLNILATPNVMHGPLFEMRQTSNTINGFTESGNHVSKYGGQSYDSNYVRLGYQLNLESQAILGKTQLHLRALKQIAQGSDEVSFFGSSLETSTDATVVGAALSWQLASGVYSSIGYEGIMGERADSHYGHFRVGFNF